MVADAIQYARLAANMGGGWAAILREHAKCLPHTFCWSSIIALPSAMDNIMECLPFFLEHGKFRLYGNLLNKIQERVHDFGKFTTRQEIAKMLLVKTFAGSFTAAFPEEIERKVFEQFRRNYPNIVVGRTNSLISMYLDMLKFLREELERLLVRDRESHHRQLLLQFYN